MELNFNPYFTLNLIAPNNAEALPFALGEHLFIHLRLYLTTDITTEITVQFHGEPYEKINPRFAAWFTPAEMEYSANFVGCWVERARDTSRYLV
ncbi:MAG: hypothetical protein H0T73_09800, partial [Ardenticatenales bacterium]|nr:hypothetical protein [Ardenticatenales bacterium]